MRIYKIDLMTKNRFSSRNSFIHFFDKMWRALFRTTRRVAKPIRTTNINIFNVHIPKRKQYSSESKGLVEKIELDKLLNEEIERLKKNKKLLSEEEAVPAEYKSILKGNLFKFLLFKLDPDPKNNC